MRSGIDPTMYAVWSPESDRIALVGQSSGQDDIYVMNADGSGEIQLTRDSANDRFPAWSPDGTTWTRLPRQTVFSTEPAAGAFDQHMACYPAIYRGETEDYLFYNGSDFGQTGIGYAIKATR